MFLHPFSTRAKFSWNQLNMRFDFVTKCATAIFIIAGVVMPSTSVAQEISSDWKINVMPYVWLPSLKADVKYGPPSGGTATANVSANESDLLNSLEMAFMIAGEARKGRWLVATDYMYLNLGKQESKVTSVDFNPGSGPVNVSTSQIGGSAESSFKGTIWSMVGGYAAISEPHASLDVIAGFRYLDLDVSSSWNLNTTVTSPSGSQTFSRSGSAGKSGSDTDFIVGAKGQVKLGQSNWFIPYYADVGAGSSTSTWQLATGVGYAFGWGDVRLDYRYLAFKQNNDNKVLQKIELGGLALGANFRF
jgi:hypothetical protein